MHTIVKTKGVQIKYYNHFEGSGHLFIFVSDFWTLPVYTVYCYITAIIMKYKTVSVYIHCKHGRFFNMFTDCFQWILFQELINVQQFEYSHS